MRAGLYRYQVSCGGVRASFHKSGYFYGVGRACAQAVCTLCRVCGCLHRRGDDGDVRRLRPRPGFFGGDCGFVAASCRTGGGCQVCRLFNGSSVVGLRALSSGGAGGGGDIQPCRFAPPLRDVAGGVCRGRDRLPGVSSENEIAGAGVALSGARFQLV